MDHEGIVGALTQTRSGTTVAAVRMILGTMEEMTEAPPSRDEVSQVVDQIVSGFVFNFESPTEIVARRMFLMAEGLPRTGSSATSKASSWSRLPTSRRCSGATSAPRKW